MEFGVVGWYLVLLDGVGCSWLMFGAVRWCQMMFNGVWCCNGVVGCSFNGVGFCYTVLGVV